MNPLVSQYLTEVIEAVERLANAIAAEPETGEPAAWPVAPVAPPAVSPAAEKYAALRDRIAARKDS